MKSAFIGSRGAWSAWAFAVALVAAPAMAGVPINGLYENPRVYDDFATSTLTLTSSNSVNPGSALIDDREFDTSGGGWANRHDIVLSADAGVSPATFSIDDGFVLSAEITLTNGLNSPRKEVGLRINSPITGDALFIINSDAGEIVAFGGGAPFHLFGNNSLGNGYTPGDTLLMGITYTPSGGGANGVPGTIEYFIDRGDGLETSGLLDWDNIEGGPVDYQVAMYGQVSPANDDDFINVLFDNISYIPEPSALLATLVGVALLRRR